MLLKAPWQWVASPLGFNVLLSKLKENTLNVEKYKQIAKHLERNEQCKMTNKLFISSSLHQNVKDLTNHIDIQETDFSKNENAFTNYVNKHGQLRWREFSSKTELILANTVLFESRWRTNGDSNPDMKLYNSFNYTQDVKYEGRLLELPLQSDFKLVVVIPNEDDVLHSLFATLSGRGLAAALNTIQPLFTAKAGLTPLNIQMRSRVEVNQVINAMSNGSAVQYGNISVCDRGTRVDVLTCIYSPASSIVKTDELITKHTDKRSPNPFYFAIIYNDTPIFIGDFYKDIISKLPQSIV